MRPGCHFKARQPFAAFCSLASDSVARLRLAFLCSICAATLRSDFYGRFIQVFALVTLRPGCQRPLRSVSAAILRYVVGQFQPNLVMSDDRSAMHSSRPGPPPTRVISRSCLVDPASSHMLVSCLRIKHSYETANGSLTTGSALTLSARARLGGGCGAGSVGWQLPRACRSRLRASTRAK